MQQFSALVTLAAADNLIDSFDQLEFLTMAAQAHMLRALSLEGNPIARLPNYRSPTLNDVVLSDIHKLKLNRYTRNALNKPVWRGLTCVART